ncbi:nucleotidyltransferase substrate binding protein [Pseudomonas sp. OIL-1]|uniref:nucleotidyltransferase substrate binding protein n=1 Tax=Pseudomonas sp. OIL-1 TaxID=2706126 RepID=UPI0013A72B19|nr:nucleotidyltransferase substrate binding protein [Pseudomonas sp. OIL-1]QIB52597.1 nucleotidyltransferase [Pseudomonas sp. OIL-1]
MSGQGIRWVQRLANFKRARFRLASAVELARTYDLSALEKLGLIKSFEFVFELAWNVMKDYFLYQGNPAVTGSRDAIRQGFKYGLIADGVGWMEMIKSRNQSAHTYNESVANEITDKIVNSYHPLFAQFEGDMQARAEEV